MLLIMRILIHNGLALFATWASIATVLGFATAFIYVDSPGDSAQLRGRFCYFYFVKLIGCLKFAAIKGWNSVRK